MAIDHAAALLAGVLAFAPPAEPPPTSPSRVDGPSSSLASALSRETRLLRREKAALQEALDEVTRGAKTSRAALEAEIEQLTAQLARLDAENIGLERSLPARERPRALLDQERQLEALINDMRSWLETRRVQTPGHSADDSGDPTRLTPLFERVVGQLEHGACVRIDEAPYFTVAGEQRVGPVLRVGHVAAVAWADDVVGTPLVDTPAGLVEAHGVAAEVSVHESGTQTSAILYEPDATPDPGEFAAPTWRARMQQGGALMWALLAFAVAGAVVGLERLVVLVATWARWRRAHARVIAARGVAERLEGLRAEPAWLRRPLELAVPALEGEPVAEDDVVQALLPLRQRLQRWLPVLGVVAAAAPLTGLLGTVTGMIATFSVVTQQGTSDPQALAGGISQALLTTQFGLAIAIPVLLLNVGLGRGARRLLGAVEGRLIDMLTTQGGRHAGDA